MKHTEIERKWLLDGFPNLPVANVQEMEQGYLSFEPSTVRIRKNTSNGVTGYKLTIKGKGTLTRTEVEFSIQEDQYNALLPLLVAPPARKKLHLYSLPDGNTMECSLVDEGEPTAFYYAEVEFASEEEANAFNPPAFLAREVTWEPGYTMAAYCRSKGQAQK